MAIGGPALAQDSFESRLTGTDNTIGLANHMRQMTHAEFRAHFDDVLAVARPPLMNPCF